MLLESQHPDSLMRIRELEAPKYRPAELPAAPITAPQFVVNLNNLDNLKEGQTAHLECQVQPLNDPNLIVEWLHNGRPLTAGHRFRTIHDFGYIALDILYVYPEDSGNYTCRVYNSLGIAETSCTLSCSGKRHIYTDPYHPESWKKIKQMEEYRPAVPAEQEIPKMKPIFIVPLKSEVIELKEGQSAHLECQLEPVNDNKLRIEWFFNGLPLKFGKHMVDYRFRPDSSTGLIALFPKTNLVS